MEKAPITLDITKLIERYGVDGFLSHISTLDSLADNSYKELSSESYKEITIFSSDLRELAWAWEAAQKQN